MSYFAAAVARTDKGWSAATVSLTDVADVEDVADQLRDLAPDADLALLFAEFDDVYLVIMRLDNGEELRVFGSDAAFANESRFGALLLGDVAGPTPDVPITSPAEEAVVEVEAVDDEEEGELPVPALTDAEPAGDADLLGDLGVPARKLLELCAQDGMLPGDITAELCQAIGCGDEVEELREA